MIIVDLNDAKQSADLVSCSKQVLKHYFPNIRCLRNNYNALRGVKNHNKSTKRVCVFVKINENFRKCDL